MSKQAFSVEDLLRMQFVGSPTLSPDGDILLWVETSILEKENCYTSVIRQQCGQETTLLTNKGGQVKGRDHSPAFSPCGTHVAFLSDRSGQTDLWLLPTRGGEATKLTSASKGVTSFEWAPDGKGIFYVSKEVIEQPKMREGSTARRITRLRYKFNGVGFYDGLWTQIYYVDIASLATKQLTSGAFNSAQPAPSPCGKYVAFCSNRNVSELNTMEDIYLLDLTDLSLKQLTHGEGPARKPQWSSDTTLMYLGHLKGSYPGGYPELREINITTGANTNLLPDFAHYVGSTIGADVRFDAGNSDPVLSSDGKSVLFAATMGGNSYLFSWERSSKRVTPLYGEGQMCISSFDEARGVLAVNVATPTDTGNIRLGRTSGQWERVTDANDKLFGERYMSWPEPMTFTHPDGTELEGWLMKPQGFVEGTKYPLVMEIHGGPHATYGNAFFHEFQLLTGEGYGVLYTNPRGSLGYGEDFARACVGDWCGVDARDLQFMAEHAVATIPWVDSKRVGVTGGSQGGYFTNWLVGHTNMFAAAVTQRSMSNLYTKYGVSDIGWSGDRHGMGGKDLWDNEEFIMERSPIRYAPNVKTPILIIHSDQDYRCPLEQAEQWYVALKRLGVPTEMLLFSGENHELSRSGKPANRLVRLEGILEWFKRYL